MKCNETELVKGKMLKRKEKMPTLFKSLTMALPAFKDKELPTDELVSGVDYTASVAVEIEVYD